MQAKIGDFGLHSVEHDWCPDCDRKPVCVPVASQLDEAIAALADEALPNTGQLLASTDPSAFLHAVRYELKWAKEREGRLREALTEVQYWYQNVAEESPDSETCNMVCAALAHGKMT